MTSFASASSIAFRRWRTIALSPGSSASSVPAERRCSGSTLPTCTPTGSWWSRVAPPRRTRRTGTGSSSSPSTPPEASRAASWAGAPVSRRARRRRRPRWTTPRTSTSPPTASWTTGIRLPHDHPSGLYWIHPHAHGLALNQVTAGLATLLTVGPMDYLCGAPGCAGRPGGPRIRHLVLQDAQVMPSGILKLQEDANFCGKSEAADQTPQGEGGCPGAGKGYDGGRWAFTLDGQVNPHLDVGSAGEIWRILNASGNATYWLGLQGFGLGEGSAFPGPLGRWGEPGDSRRERPPATFRGSSAAKHRSSRAPTSSRPLARSLAANRSAPSGC